MTDTAESRPSLDPNNPAQVAHAIALMCDQLEAATAVYRDDIERAARSSAAYKMAWARGLLAVINEATGRRTTVAEREALVEDVLLPAFSPTQKGRHTI